MLKVQNADIYTDFNGLAKLKNEARNQTPEAIEEVAKQFESVFLNMVLKSMRQAKLSDSMLDNNHSKFYQDMYDQQLAVHLSGDPGIGLADLIVKQLSPKQNHSQEKMTAGDYLTRSAATPKQETQQKINKLKNSSDQPITTQGQFIKQLLPFAEQAGSELGVDAKVLLSQAALETGWGKSVINQSNGNSTYNLFNIKADKSWRQQQVKQTTLEFSDGIGRKQTAAFRSYDSFQESFNDYVDFIKTNPRYGNALKMASNPNRYMQELQKAGYATDPDYAAKVMRIYNSNALNGNMAVVALK